MSPSSFDNNSDVIDSRDIIARIEELEIEFEDLGTVTKQITSHYTSDEIAQMRQELTLLIKIVEQGDTCSDWNHGATLIRESYFVEYIEKLINESYDIPESTNYPFSHMQMDYEGAAKEAEVDYIDINFDGVTYLVRA